MKARVKATGALLIVRPYGDSNFYWICDMGGENGTLWKTEQLDFIDDFDPDYWEKLKHQYAGMALQGILSNPEQIALYDIDCVAQAVRMADLLINKLKEEKK
jgi:hypothetical protein